MNQMSLRYPIVLFTNGKSHQALSPLMLHSSHLIHQHISKVFITEQFMIGMLSHPEYLILMTLTNSLMNPANL